MIKLILIIKEFESKYLDNPVVDFIALIMIFAMVFAIASCSTIIAEW